jgi:hypothetical protein
MSVLDHSYQFAREFNDDKDLRTGLWKVGECFEFCRFNDGLFMPMSSGFMKHLPNLLKQESSSAATLVHVLLRMYYDNRPDHETARPQIAKQLMPSVSSHLLGFSQSHRENRLGLGVLQDFSKLRADTQAKNIAAWTPVVAEILEGFCRFDDKAVRVTRMSFKLFVLNLCAVRKVSTSDLPSGYRTSCSRYGTRNPAGFEDVFCSGWVCPLNHRGLIAFIPCMIYYIISIITHMRRFQVYTIYQMER